MNYWLNLRILFYKISRIKNLIYPHSRVHQVKRNYFYFLVKNLSAYDKKIATFQAKSCNDFGELQYFYVIKITIFFTNIREFVISN